MKEGPQQQRESAEKISAEVMFCIGVGITIIGCYLAFQPTPIDAFAHMAWALGVGLMIPYLILTTTKYVSKKIELYSDKPPKYLFLDAIKNMNSEFFRCGITLFEIHEDKDFYNAIVAKIKDTKTPLAFKFLLLDPNSDFIKAREKEQGEKPGALSEQVWITIDILQKIKKAINSLNIKNVTFECGIYKTMPTLSIFQIDERLFIGPYLYKRLGYESPWVEIPPYEEKTRLEYKKTFDKLWDDAEKIDLSSEIHRKSS